MTVNVSYPLLLKFFVTSARILILGLLVTPVIAQEPAKTVEPSAVVQEDKARFEELQKSVRKLAVEVERLARRVADLEKDHLFNVTRVRLVSEEQRAEALQSRLRETYERQVNYQARLELIDTQLRPENIEKLFIGVGMVRPEEARETVRKRLSLEKQALVVLMESLRQERNRLQASLTTADTTIQRLRQRLTETSRP
ncbi:MAG TPA: hypothetical protein VJU86_11050 [Pyrinomonadaceae bacterium]|nr:hypothetical protein [Pyrinomonadaceae bacterium]